MKNKQIVFTGINTAKLLDIDDTEIFNDEILVKTEFTALSAGTERANITGEKNIHGIKELCNTEFPRTSGYSGVGTVAAIGNDVKNIAVGDRVIICFGKHKQYNIIKECNAVKIPYDSIPSKQAALTVISTFSMLGVRKTQLEIGESAMVMGLGILGLIAVQIYKAGGAVPVIAVDPNPERRQLAIEIGADYALDPTEANFADRVKQLTLGKGVDAVTEVSGVDKALVQALDCCAKFARVSLLGCTRKPCSEIDFYHQVHYPGVVILGANTWARPLLESRPGSWTHEDDCLAVLKLLATGRLSFDKLINEVHSPIDAPEVYERLVSDKNFPIGVLFDWTTLDGSNE